MNIMKKILEEMKTPEGQEKLKKWAEEYQAKIDTKNNKMREMFSDTNYMKWLENFTMEHPTFTGETWLYFEEQISKEDKEKVDNLQLLYEGIELYANKNYIYHTPCDFGGYYNIKLDNVCYEIGMLVGQGTLFFCNRIPSNKDLEYIDFNDIISGKKNNNVTAIENRLSELSTLVISLYNSGIPLEAISTTLDNVLKEIKSQNKSKNTKTLSKKINN